MNSPNIMLLSLLVICIMLFPLILTLLNLLLLIFKKAANKVLATAVDSSVFAFGIPMTATLVMYFDFHEWNEAIYPMQDYTPISFESLPTFAAIVIISFLSYLVVRIFGTRLPPLCAALSYAGMFIGIALYIAFIVQCSVRFGDVFEIYITLLPLNYIICSIRAIRSSAKEYSKKISQIEYSSPILIFCQRTLSTGTRFVLFSFILALPLLTTVIVILLLFGQKPDSLITGFTNTAEWTLSQKIPPPRLDYHGHYLCTVAACGDEKTVKPLRAGKRCGRLIIVNRQLLVANAFEDLIYERTPHLHKLVRGVYDSCGLPVSRYITTKRRSNAVYYLMKPLEWLFVVVLYTFDRDPETRIALQYTK